MVIKLPHTIEEMKKRGEDARNDLALALGNFSVRFLHMEAALDGLIHELLELAPDTGHALTSAVFNTSTRLQILGSLNEDLKTADTFRADIRASLKEAKDLNRYRNWLLHDRWMVSVPIDDKSWAHHKRRMRDGKWQEEAFTSDSIMKRAEECASVTQRVMTIRSTLHLARLEANERKKAE